jgi:hypothetical protein
LRQARSFPFAAAYHSYAACAYVPHTPGAPIGNWVSFMVSFLLLLLSGDSLIRSGIPAIDNLFNICDDFLDSSTSVNISPMIIVLQWRSPKHQEAIGLRNFCGRRRIVCALGLLLASSALGFKF